MLAYVCYCEHTTTHTRDASAERRFLTRREGGVGICGVHEVLLAYAGHGTVAQHWTGTLCVCTHTIPVGPGTHIYGGHA